MKIVIYQLVVRYFGNTNTTNQTDGSLAVNGCGKFADISDIALLSLRRLGITHIWLTGCLRQATLTDYSEAGLSADDPDAVKGIAGSFYAIRDYFDVCPDYAQQTTSRMTEFESLIERIHAAKMKCVIDFVPNHVARTYLSVVKPELNIGNGDDTTTFFQRDNHFFYLVDPPGQKLRLSRPSHWNPNQVKFDGELDDENGTLGRPPKASGNNVTAATVGADDWYETVKLNYGFNFVEQSHHYFPVPRTWGLMNEVIAYWQAKGVDGFRCDFAHYIPSEFWSWLITNAHQRNSEALFIAEAYPWIGSGDPIANLQELIAAGFDAVYHDAAYDILKRIYQGTADQNDYDREMKAPPVPNRYVVEYLENHDERRVSSPLIKTGSPDSSGFGSADAGYQLAPLQYLYGCGPVLLLNGQEVGEIGAGLEGYNIDDGRTTFFDYWAMPHVARWVNNHKYDGDGLTASEHNLRSFYSALLNLCQDSSVKGNGYWGLKYFNRPDRFGDCPEDLYSFARFQDGSGRVLIVVANFCSGGQTNGRIRIPIELANVARISGVINVRHILDRSGGLDVVIESLTADEVCDKGFYVSIPNQSTHVFAVSNM